MNNSDLTQTVKRIDPDRWMVSRFAPADGRKRLIALYAFADEIARAPWVTSEPMIAQIRLAWWREAVAEVFATPNKARRHPVVGAMVQAFPAGAPRPTEADFEALIDAREPECDRAEWDQMDDLVRHVDNTAGRLAIAALSCLAGEHVIAPQDRDAALLVGRAWGLTGYARAFAEFARAGRMPAVTKALEAIGKSKEDLERARNPYEGRQLIAPLLTAASETHRAAQSAMADVQPSLWPALGYGAIIPAYLNAMTRDDYDPWTSRIDVPRVRRQAIFVWRSVSGGL